MSMLATAADSPRSNKDRESDMLWYVNSQGCIRQVVMDYYQSCIDPRNLSKDGQPCCDRCFWKSGVDPTSWLGYPVVHTTPFRNVYGEYREVKEADNGTVENLVLPPKMSADSVHRIGLAVHLALECHRNSLVYSRKDLLDEKHLLPDMWMCSHEEVIRRQVDLARRCSRGSGWLYSSLAARASQNQWLSTSHPCPATVKGRLSSEWDYNTFTLLLIAGVVDEVLLPFIPLPPDRASTPSALSCARGGSESSPW